MRGIFAVILLLQLYRTCVPAVQPCPSIERTLVLSLRGGGYAYQKPGTNKLAPRHTQGQIHAHEVPGQYTLEVHRNFNVDDQEWVGGTVENAKEFWGKVGPPPMPEAVPELVELALGRRINAPINEEVALAWVKMTDERLQQTLQEEEAAQEEVLPLVCEKCLGPNLYVKMYKHEDDGTCKICSETFSWFRWKPDTIDVRFKVRWKKTIICTPCARAKDLCQTCLFDLKLSLPAGIRDTLLEKGPGAFLPESMQRHLPAPPTGNDQAEQERARENLKMLESDRRSRNGEWKLYSLSAPGEAAQELASDEEVGGEAGAENEAGEEGVDGSSDEDEGVRPELHGIEAMHDGEAARPLALENGGKAHGREAPGRTEAVTAVTKQQFAVGSSVSSSVGSEAESQGKEGGGSSPDQEPPSLAVDAERGGALAMDSTRGMVVPHQAAGALTATDKHTPVEERRPLDAVMNPVDRSKALLTAELLGARQGWQKYYQQNRARICSFWMTGECTKGLSCEYRHEKPTFYEARDMGLIQGVKGSNADLSIIQRYYGDPKDEVAKSMLRDVNKRHPNLLQRAQWPRAGRHTASEVPAITSGGAAPSSKRTKLAGEFVPGRPAQMVAAWDQAKRAPSREAIRALFQTHGEVLSVRVVANKGIAFVKFRELRGAYAAYKAVGQGTWLGKLRISCSPHAPS